MTIYPAIDIYDGKAVRLCRGDYEQMTVYNDNPVSVARSFEDTGASALHIVDLEGARSGKPENSEAISKIAAGTNLFIQVGGGIRTMPSIEMYLNIGVRRVILGTAAISEPGFLREAVGKHGDAICAGADIKDGVIAIRGWTELSDRDIFSFCNDIKSIGIKTIICTDISKDGMQSGSNIELYNKLSLALPDVGIIASGGVSSLREIKTLAGMNLSGVIVGKALYEGKISLADALLAQ